MRNIVYLTDENYAMPTCVSIVSLIKNNTSKTNYKVYILVDEISDETRNKLQALEDEYVTCEIIDVYNKEYESLATTCLLKGIHVSKTALFKFDIANILGDIDEVLYLDGDTIINHDISNLFNIDISEYYLAAVDDMGDVISEDGKSSQAQRIGIENRTYFNSGVMYLNLRKMRTDDVAKRLLKYRIEETNYFMDQDALNAILGERRVELSTKYNFLTAMLKRYKKETLVQNFCDREFGSLEMCVNEQEIIHMADQYKPWVYEMPLLTMLFKQYYYASPYRNVELHVMGGIELYYGQIGYIAEEYESLNKKYLQMCKRKSWLFPYGEVKKDSNIVLYGAGDVGQDFYNQIMLTGYCELVLWVDKNWMSLGEGIVSPENIRDKEFDYLIIAVADKVIAESIKTIVESMGVNEDKIVLA